MKKSTSLTAVMVLCSATLFAQFKPELYIGPTHKQVVPANQVNILLNNNDYVLHQVNQGKQTPLWVDSVKIIRQRDQLDNPTTYLELRRSDIGSMDTLSYNISQYLYDSNSTISEIATTCTGLRDNTKYKVKATYNGRLQTVEEETAALGSSAYTLNRFTNISYDANNKISKDSVSRGITLPGAELYQLTHYTYFGDSAIVASIKDYELGQMVMERRHILRMANGKVVERREEIGPLVVSEKFTYGNGGDLMDYLINWMGADQEKVVHHFHADHRLDAWTRYQPDSNIVGAWIPQEKLVMHYDAAQRPDTAFVYPWQPALQTFDTVPHQRYLFKSPIVGLSQHQNENLAFTVFPNPASDIITFRIDAANFKVITVFDLIGKIVLTATTKGDTLNISTLPVGQYIIRINQSFSRFVKK